MKIQILRLLVLIVSISAASVLVWNATRNQKPKETQEDGVISPESMQGSSKSKVIGVDFFELEEDDYTDKEITEEEVKATRDAMLSTSKSGRVMSDDQIRELLEKRANLKTEIVGEHNPHLMNSSKSGPAMTIDEFLKFIEARQKTKPENDDERKPSLMHSSKSFSSPIFKSEDLQKIIEGEKKDPNAE